MTIWVTITRGGITQEVPEQDLLKYTKAGFKRAAEREVKREEAEDQMSEKAQQIQKDAEVTADLKTKLDEAEEKRIASDKNAEGNNTSTSNSNKVSNSSDESEAFRRISFATTQEELDAIGNDYPKPSRELSKAAQNKSAELRSVAANADKRDKSNG